jgi:hypothetical protein
MSGSRKVVVHVTSVRRRKPETPTSSSVPSASDTRRDSRHVFVVPKVRELRATGLPWKGRSSGERAHRFITSTRVCGR